MVIRSAGFVISGTYLYTSKNNNAVYRRYPTTYKMYTIYC